MGGNKRSGLAFGVVLIAVGSILMVTRLAPVQTAPAWLLGLGLALALIGILQRRYAPMVAGMILLGVGAGMVLGDVRALGMSIRAWRLIALGLGFLGVFALGALIGLSRRWWPLVPGIVLIVLGVAPSLRDLLVIPPQLEILVRTWWPVALVVAGLVVVIRSLRR